MDMYNNILDVKGLKVGQVQDEDGLMVILLLDFLIQLHLLIRLLKCIY